ncbi:MAG: hypothetical protein ACO31E_12515 [Phycisphaerales bacterium]
MSRRRAGRDDSLELLLDPICNMFGTIMFVALIAALLALMRSGEIVERVVSAAERRQESTAEQLEARASDLEPIRGPLPSAEGRGRDSAAAARVSRALAEIARRERIIERYGETLDSARNNIEGVGSQLEPMRDEIERLQDAVDDARRAKDRQVRTPLEREVALFEYTLVLWRDRIYPICDLSNRPREACEWLRQWHPRHVVPERCSTPVFECSRVNIHIARSVRLRESAGIPAGDLAALRADPDFAALMKTLDPSQDLIGFIVAPDSFDSFAVVKQAFLSEGFSYSVEPCEQPLPAYRDAWIPGNPRGL